MKKLKFNADMAQAVKDGRKTQTRRPLKPQPPEVDFEIYCDPYNGNHERFTFWTTDGRMCLFDGNISNTAHWKCPYGNIGDTHDIDGTQIKITDIRVELLQDISEEDAIAEGVDECDAIGLNGWYPTYNDPDSGGHHDYKRAFELLIWEQLPYKPPYDWNSNPYVLVIEFEKVAK